MKPKTNNGREKPKSDAASAKSLECWEEIRVSAGIVGMDPAAFTSEVLGKVATQVSGLWERAKERANGGGEGAFPGGNGGRDGTGSMSSSDGKAAGGKGSGAFGVFWFLLEQACYEVIYGLLISKGVKPGVARTAASSATKAFREWSQR